MSLALVLATLLPQTVSSADFSAIWDGGNGNWDDPLHWSTNPNYPNNAGGMTYDATINNGNVRLDRNITIQRLFFNNGTLSGPFELTLNEGITWTSSRIDFATINLAAGSTSTIDNDTLTGTINNSGTVQNTVLVLNTTGTINNLAGATWTMGWGINPFNGMFTPSVAGVLNNAGNLVVARSSSSEPPNYLRTTFNNTGNVTLTGLTNLFVDRGSATGAFDLGAATTLTFFTYTLASGATITGTGTATVNNNGGSLTIAGDATISASLVNRGTLLVESGATLTLKGTFTNAGITRLDGGAITSMRTLNFEGGLRGSGIINADVITRAMFPGASANISGSAGKLAINGSLSFLTDFPYPDTVMEIGGLTPGKQYDYIDVNGALSLAGYLDLLMLNDFELQLAPDQTFTLFTSNSLSGGFYNVANGGRLTTDDHKASFQVNYGPGSPFGANNVVLSDPRVVPEPASLVLFTAGAVLFGLVRFRKR